MCRKIGYLLCPTFYSLCHFSSVCVPNLCHWFIAAGFRLWRNRCHSYWTTERAGEWSGQRICLLPFCCCCGECSRWRYSEWYSNRQRQRTPLITFKVPKPIPSVFLVLNISEQAWVTKTLSDICSGSNQLKVHTKRGGRERRDDASDSDSSQSVQSPSYVPTVVEK